MSISSLMSKITIFIFCSLLLACTNQTNGRTIQTSNDSTVTVCQTTNEETIFYEIPRFKRTPSSEQLLYRYSYVTSYNKNTLCPNWVGWNLTSEHTDGEFTRRGHSFVEDLDVPSPRALYSDIRESECGYQRGHMCPAGDNKWSRDAQNDAFLMTNICPQNGDLNQRDWKYLEEQCRFWAQQYGSIYIVAGPIFNSCNYKTVGDNKVAIPDAFFKVILAFDNDNPKAIGFIYNNVSGHNKMESYAHSVDYVEKITGLDFFYQLEDKIEDKIEAQENYSSWGLK